MSEDPFFVEQIDGVTIRKVHSRFVCVLPGSERIGPPVNDLKTAQAQVRAYLDGEQPAGSETQKDAGSTAAGPSAPPELPAGYSIKRRGPWYTVYDRDGEKVGSDRSESGAIEIAVVDVAGVPG